MSNSKIYLCFCIALIFVVLLSINIGPVEAGWSDLLSDSFERDVLLNIRLPRLILGLIVGMALSSCGASMQGLFRNPLADPGLIGISSGAALFVAIIIVIFSNLLDGITGLYILSFAAFCGAMTSAFIITLIAKRHSKIIVVFVLLCGIAINAISGALIGLLTFFSTDDQLRTLTLWTMGSLSGANWTMVIVSASLIIPCLIILIKSSIGLNILALGEESAVHAGLDYEKLKKQIIISVSIAIGASVAVSGFIGFVGLVIPHILRQIFGPEHRRLMGCSMLLGAFLLIISDLLARTIIAPAEMPVGLITATIGGPIFLYILIKEFRKNT
jgi:iron complex transport system permease protein